MSMNEIIINALSEIAPTYPYELDENDGDERERRRIVFNYETIPIAFGNDVPAFEKYLVQVHYFCPYKDDTTDVRVKIRIALFNADFTFPEETAVTTGSPQEEQHYCFECEYLLPVEWDTKDSDDETEENTE